MSGRVKFTDKDNGYKALVKRVFGIAKPSITAGIHAAEGAQTNPKKGKATVLEYGTYSEFGLGVPERSFIRGTVDTKGKDWQAFAASRFRMVVAGTLTKEQALEQLGLKMQSDIQQRIADGVPPPNAPSTIAAKGSSTPLIDTGLLRSSVTYTVKE
jgi:hypothetical protein